MAKHILILIIVLSTSISLNCSGSDSLFNYRTLYQKNKVIEQELKSNGRKFEEQRQCVLHLSDSLRQTNLKICGLSRKNQEKFSEIESLITLSNYQQARINIYILCCAILMVIVIIALCYISYRLKKTNQKLSLDIEKFVLETERESSWQELNSSLLNFLEKNKSKENDGTASILDKDHSLILTITDEMVRLQNNISRLDKDDKNVQRIEKSLVRMKTSLIAYGYEIVDMIGQEYTDNMPFEARFIPDDDLEEGKSIITGMDKLMVRFNGKMIQAPKLVVRQN